MQKRNKKGFTLAELLIVVAIIAVLVAIAVPLFVGALGNAEKRVEDANVRAVRGAAVVAILSDDSGKLLYGNESQKLVATYWNVNAEVNSNGNIIKLEITPKLGTPEGGLVDTLAANKEGDIYKVTGNIVELKAEKK